MSPSTPFFEQLVKAYASDLFRYAFWLSKDRDIAEDLVQETFSRAWKSIDKLKDEKAAKAWLITILRRENARRFEKYQPDLVEIEAELMADDVRYEPDEKLEKQLLYQAILSLDPQFKEPLMLQVQWGFSGEEIAEQLGLKLATVNTRLFRARQQLKKILTQAKSAKSLTG
ncbi:sigma-70 family RNA polymerase sigma factor [Hydrogenovibrio sp. 3SP14C1]|uniref:sigma-70 family RNA polymerase sigma factor n=1 Tax=Hydrogenovibrio sp. 3SP14C1 TaxID=3038774 RepID=UPI0024165131|nr:sigma-70 family RNA polymerase sigma factor [Hydrogenovibrio sp. 3SP14C1]MDG4812339.1 sigma-70 family RNA polymerase sigma factor [Hydrogenovibrio sp. 3SP14C1]